MSDKVQILEIGGIWQFLRFIIAIIDYSLETESINLEPNLQIPQNSYYQLFDVNGLSASHVKICIVILNLYQLCNSTS